MKSSEVLRKAQGELKRRGWHQGRLGSDKERRKDCPVCAWGALNAAVTGDPWDYGDDAGGNGGTWDIAEAVSTALDDWNDFVAQSVEEVLDRFEEAAVLAERNGD